MNSLTRLYIVAGFQFLVQVVSRFLWQGPEIALIRLSLTLMLLVLVVVFMHEDIKLRKLSKIYLLYALISPVGIILYHLIHARKNPIK